MDNYFDNKEYKKLISQRLKLKGGKYRKENLSELLNNYKIIIE